MPAFRGLRLAAKCMFFAKSRMKHVETIIAWLHEELCSDEIGWQHMNHEWKKWNAWITIAIPDVKKKTVFRILQAFMNDTYTSNSCGNLTLYVHDVNHTFFNYSSVILMVMCYFIDNLFCVMNYSYWFVFISIINSVYDIFALTWSRKGK